MHIHTQIQIIFNVCYVKKIFVIGFVTFNLLLTSTFKPNRGNSMKLRFAQRVNCTLLFQRPFIIDLGLDAWYCRQNNFLLLLLFFFIFTYISKLCFNAFNGTCFQLLAKYTSLIRNILKRKKKERKITLF